MGNGKRKASENKEAGAGALTATQLRNRRKRRKQKEDKKAAKAQGGGANIAGPLGSGRKKNQDPSQRYISKPTKAPIVRRAVQFFRDNPPSDSEGFKVTVGPLKGWRTVAKLAVRSCNGLLKIGLFAPGTHDLLDLPTYPAHHPSVNAAMGLVQKRCRKANVEAFNEATGEGSLRYLTISVERSTGRQQITLVWNGRDQQSKERQDIIHRLVEASKNRDIPSFNLHSLWIHYDTSWKHSNSIYSRDGEWERVHGDEDVLEKLDIPSAPSVALRFPPQVFRQANIDQFTQIVAKIRSWVSDHGKKDCLELYGGVGTIALHLSDSCKSIVSSDENPFNKKCFETSLQELKGHGQKISYVSKNASAMVNAGHIEKADLVVVDPPRKGLEETVSSALASTKRPKLLVYVSCGFEAFTKDFEVLTRRGNWNLEHAEGHVLFPGSDAIETLAFFTR